MAERYTRLSQKQVLRGLRVRIPLSAPIPTYRTSQVRIQATWDVFNSTEISTYPKSYPNWQIYSLRASSNLLIASCCILGNTCEYVSIVILPTWSVTQTNHHQEGLAELANLDRTYISQIERGLKSPSITALTSLARGLEVKAYVLVREMEDELDTTE